MKVGSILQKYKYGPDKLTIKQILRMSWENGGFALGERLGRLEPTFKADLAVLDINTPPEFCPKDLKRMKSNIVFFLLILEMYLVQWLLESGCILTRNLLIY